ncbi:oxidoreductase, partial [Oleiphilus sp. HI0065]
RKGQYPDVKDQPPFTPGYDLVGRVDKIGPEASGFALGDLVADLTVIGAYAEYICLDADKLTLVPEGCQPNEAVSLILSYITAYQMLHRIAKVQKRQSILIHGAGGAVGTAMLQLAKQLGAKVYGSGSKSKHSLIESLGAIPVDYNNTSWPEQVIQNNSGGLDAVFDPIGGESFKRSFSVLRKGGTIVGYGFYNAVSGKGGSIAKDFLTIKLWNLLPNGKHSHFYSIADLRKKHPDWFKKDLTTLFQMLKDKKIEPVIGAVLSLDEAAKAHELIEKAEMKGKIVLKISE